MSFPACRHRRKSTPSPGVLVWLAAEPFRLFFLSGAVWSIIGVSLWPLWHAQALTFYPGITHARIMIECFGGAFVAGFLGTAGPRMATAPKLIPAELAALFALHTACGIQHIRLNIAAGDQCFTGLLVLLLLCLLVRVVHFRKEAPPPQLLLALTGLVCGAAGATMLQFPNFLADPGRLRLANLLLYQGLLLPPVLGIGSFLFPRILGGSFGEPATPQETRIKLIRALLAAGLIVGSFFVETAGAPVAGCLLRAVTCVVYLGSEIRWRRTDGDEPRGSLTTGLYWALGTGLAGLIAAAVAYQWHVGLEHLLYVGGFGLLMLIVASRVLFGHSGDLAGFSRRSWVPRTLTGLAVIAATTRASADIWPRITVSHHKYAAWAWALAALLWLIWHARRFVRREMPDTR